MGNIKIVRGVFDTKLELEHAGVAAGFLQSEGFCVYPVHEELVEVAYECCQQQEHSVLCHEGLWQPYPSEAIVPPHSRRHRSRHLTKNQQSRCTDNRTMCTEVQEFCRLPDLQNGKMLPYVKYFSECSDFFNFFAYLCYVIYDFCLF